MVVNRSGTGTSQTAAAIRHDALESSLGPTINVWLACQKNWIDRKARDSRVVR